MTIRLEDIRQGGGGVTGADREPGYRFRRSSEMARDSVRVEAFSDAVIAVALTVMAVELLQFSPDVPKDKGLGAALEHEWRSYLAYVITFAALVVGPPA